MELYPHNKIVYENILRMLKIQNRVGVVQGTGTGKGVICKKLVDLFPNVIIVVPTNVLIENYKLNLGLSIEKVRFLTYHGLSLFTEINLQEIIKPNTLLVLDEFHRVGAKTWGKNVEILAKSIENLKGRTVGFSATPIRYLDNSRNMIDEFFGGNVVEGLDFVNAVVDGVLPSFTYVSSFYGNIENAKFKYSERVSKLINTLENNYNIQTIIENHINTKEQNQKWIIFFSNIEELKSFKNNVKDWFSFSSSVHFFDIHSEYSKSENIAKLRAFNDANTGVNIILSVNMLNEGVHLKDLNGVIMFRKTVSPIVYLQQLGRAFKVNGIRPIIFDFIGNYKEIGNFRNINIDIGFIEEINKAVEEKGLSKERKIIVYSYCEKISEILRKICEIEMGHWTNEEIDLLIKYYSIYSTKEIQEKYLPDKSLFGIYTKAYNLGLSKTKGGNSKYTWDDKDKKLLRESYLSGGIELCEKNFPLVTRTTLYTRLREIGCIEGYVQEPVVPWSDEEIEILKKYYPIEGGKILKRLPNRTAKGIASMAKKYGLQTENYQNRNIIGSFTPEEDAYIKEHYPKEGRVAVAEKLNRSVDSTRKRAKLLGVKYLGDESKIYTSEEDGIISKYYPIEGAEGVANRLNKRVESIRYRAEVLGVKYIDSRLYTPEEDAILIKYYPIEGLKVQERFSNRTVKSVYSRCKYLGLVVENKNSNLGMKTEKAMTVFTAEEDDIIHKYYPLEGSNVYKRLKNKTDRQVISRAIRLGITAEKFAERYYTLEEEEILRKYYPIEGLDVQKRLVNRTESSIRSKVSEMGLKKENRHFYTPEEDEIIRKYYAIEGTDVYKRIPGVDAQSIMNRASKLGITQGKREKSLYTPEEDAILYRYFPIEGYEVVKRLPNRSKDSIKTRVKRLGITRNRV